MAAVDTAREMIKIFASVIAYVKICFPDEKRTASDDPAGSYQIAKRFLEEKYTLVPPEMFTRLKSAETGGKKGKSVSGRVTPVVGGCQPSGGGGKDPRVPGRFPSGGYTRHRNYYYHRPSPSRRTTVVVGGVVVVNEQVDGAHGA